MDDSGYFSVQVIASALKVWSLEITPYNSQHPVAQTAQADPTVQKAYICNYKDHWFTVRKIGHQWYNLNSLLSGPELISTTYLSMFLMQLQQEGYAIFIVMGILPECEADQVLGLLPLVPPTRTQRSEQTSTLQDDVDLQAALCLSLSGIQQPEVQPQTHVSSNLDDDEEEMLRTALRMSMEST